MTSTTAMPHDVDDGFAPGATSSVADPPERTHPIAWWGMLMLVVTEAMVFVGLLSAYFFVRSVSTEWPQGGIEPPDLARAIVFSVVLLGSSIPIVWAEHAVRRDRMRQVRTALAIAFVLAAAFLANQADEYAHLGFVPSDNAYASLFVVITGLHGIHVLGALVMSTMVQAKAWTGRIDSRHDLTLRVFSIYWHFVDGVWIAVFAGLYAAVHIGSR